MFIDEVQGCSIQLAAGLRILYERVDWTSETVVVPVDCEAQRPSGPKRLDWYASVPAAPMPIPTTHPCKTQQTVEVNESCKV